MKVKNKVIVVTGGGSGIGRELVLSLLQRGSRVAALDINQDALLETMELAGPDKRERLSLHVINISEKTSIDQLPGQILERHGQVDGIINNAGIIQPFVKLNNLDQEVVQRLFNINFFGPYYMIRAFLPHLMERPSAHIVNVSSMGGFLPVPGQTIYGATKAALKLMTEGLISELADTNVHVSVVYPGAIQTNITANSGIDVPGASSGKEKKFKAMDAALAAGQMIEGMEKGKERMFIGKDSKMMDLLYRLSPGYAARLIAKNMKSLLNS